MSNTKVKTRFSPSPSGLMHIGNARTALFSALFAYKHSGVFLLRIEDTDATRSEQQYIDALCQDLRWLGITWQEGYQQGGANQPYQQCQRSDIYDKYLAILTEQKQIYPCFCSAEKLSLSRSIQLKMGKPPRYDGTCRLLRDYDNNQTHALRFKVDSGTIAFVDFIKGHQQYQCQDIGDFIIKRSEGSESFFFSNAIDDALMGVTHVLRGEDHLTNTPRQLMLLEALSLPKPDYGHMSLILGSDGKPLSKRNGSMSINELRTSGYFAIAVVNYLARLGHRFQHNDLLDIKQLSTQFDIKKLSKSPAKFDLKHLQYWQQQALNKLDNQSLWQWLEPSVIKWVPSQLADGFVDAVRDNILLPSDARHWAKILFSACSVSEENQMALKAIPQHFLQTLLSLLEENLNYDDLLAQLKQATNLTGRHLFLPLRLALTTQTSGPELAKLYVLMDKQLLRERVKSLR